MVGENNVILGGGNSNIFYVHPYLGKIPILTNAFQMGWFNHQLVILVIFVGIFSILPTGAGNSEVSLKRQGVMYCIIYSFAYNLLISPA